MKELNIYLSNQSGLHARPAKNFVNFVKGYSSDIAVLHGEKKANGKSLISILTLGVESGSTIRIEINGEDEETVFRSLKESIENGLLGE